MIAEVTTPDASTMETAAEARRVYTAGRILARAAWRRGTLHASGSGRRPLWSPFPISPRFGVRLRRSRARGFGRGVRRRFMSQKLFIGGLPFSTSTQELGQLFKQGDGGQSVEVVTDPDTGDRKSTRLKSSHSQNSYAVFCLKKKKTNKCVSE